MTFEIASSRHSWIANETLSGRTTRRAHASTKPASRPSSAASLARTRHASSPTLTSASNAGLLNDRGNGCLPVGEDRDERVRACDLEHVCDILAGRQDHQLAALVLGGARTEQQHPDAQRSE